MAPLLSPPMNGAYINHLDSDAGMKTVLDNIPGSTTTDYLLLSLNVAGVDANNKPSADINYGWNLPCTLARDGKITDWTRDHLCKVVSAGVTQGKCKRVWLVIGGASDGPQTDAFTNIQTILDAGGTLASTLATNFKAIYFAINNITGVEAVGFDMDYEENLDSLTAAVTNVSIFLFNNTACSITFCPFQGEQDDQGNYPGEQAWINALKKVYSWTNGKVVGYNLQTYSGGGSNNPKQWADYLADAGIVSDPYSFVWPIVSNGTDAATPSYEPSEVVKQLKNWGSATGPGNGFHSRGASLWATSGLSDPPQPPNTLAAYANAIAQGIA
jgi:hypothetical protein